ncbi:outer membrane protein OmpA-like peptidoglycan-associated protein [Pedobacter cryoconitis]|uniref:OmpA family protein n=1 Tax=Pedobacter cryoconitis TaxID=188932 RepID=UPI0016097408|nr:OmpA family protein [Pedobacter cryoconitis]MBB6272816.1 outer membrane protein OmpA-like peptidoglycan-associated protein [Pedobacter cryoconitis]
MLKGVKKIKWEGTGKVFGNLSIPNYKLTIAPDQWVYFIVGEWFPGTTEEDKKKTVTWVRQSGDKKIEFKKTVIPARDIYGYQITRKQCGSYNFYIEATLSGIKDAKNNTGLLVGGYCEQKLIKSSWIVDEPGNDNQITTDNPTIYGVPLKLHLELEGLNGDDCVVEIYNTSLGTIKRMRKTYGIKCVNGDIELQIPAVDTMAWYNELGGLRKPKEHFFIKVKGDPAKGYVTDEKRQDKHATHLYINNKMGTFIEQIMPAKTSTPAKTGQQAESYVMHGCKFQSINVTDRGKPKLLFDEREKLTFGSNEPKFKFDLKIYYDTDQYDIRADAKPVMDNLAKLLKSNPQISLLIESYADIRKDAQYNMDLTEKRANGVLSYLNTHGVTNKLSTKWYGSSKAKQFIYETNIDTPIHKLNRYTELTFYTPGIKAIFYNTIVPTLETPIVLDFRIANFNIKNCMMASDPAKKHDEKKAKYLELTNEESIRTVAKDVDINGGLLKIPVFADIAPMLPIVLPPLRTLTPNRFQVSINSCNYFPDKTKPTVIVQAFTDALWIFHASYDYDESFYFKKEGKEQKVKIVKGIETLYGKVEKYLEMYFSAIKWVPMFTISAYAQEWLVNYIREESKMYGLGYHKRWNWTGGSFDGFAREDDYTEKHRIVTEIAILTLTILVIVVEVVIAVLTGGETAAAKLPKLKKAARFLKEAKAVKDKMEDLGFEFIFPKVAMNRGLYLKKGSDGNIYYMIEDNVSAKPLIAIQYKKTFKLADLVASVKHKKNAKATIEENAAAKTEISKEVQAVLNKIGGDAELTLEFIGRIEANYELKIALPMTANAGDKKITVLNLLNSALSNSSGEVIGEDTIKARIFLEATGKRVIQIWKPLRKYVPPIGIDGALKLNLEGYITHKRTYGVDVSRGPYYKDQIYFSGIKGYVTLKSKLTVDGEKVLELNPDDEKLDFVLFEPQNIDIADVQLY